MVWLPPLSLCVLPAAPRPSGRPHEAEVTALPLGVVVGAPGAPRRGRRGAWSSMLGPGSSPVVRADTRLWGHTGKASCSWSLLYTPSSAARDGLQGQGAASEAGGKGAARACRPHRGPCPTAARRVQGPGPNVPRPPPLPRGLGLPARGPRLYRGLGTEQSPPCTGRPRVPVAPSCPKNCRSGPRATAGSWVYPVCCGLLCVPEVPAPDTRGWGASCRSVSTERPHLG